MKALDPLRQFSQWFQEAKSCNAIEDATAMCLSTLGTDGFPDGRMVLLKDFNERGFTFYTNLHSAKGRALKKIPKAALTFHWAPLKKQVRIQGKTEIVSAAEADAYWKTRPRLSQAGRLGIEAKRHSFQPHDSSQERRKASTQVRNRSHSSSAILDRGARHPSPYRILAGPAQPPPRPVPLHEEWQRMEGRPAISVRIPAMYNSLHA